MRLTRTFLLDTHGRRPIYGGTEKFRTDPFWRDNIYFLEYFHGDIGAGLGASHQTGWTGLVANSLNFTASSIPSRCCKQADKPCSLIKPEPLGREGGRS